MSGIPATLEVAASTGVLQERRQHALAASPSGAVLGRHFLTLRGLAEACAAESPAPLQGELDEIALARIARHAARDLPGLGERVEQRPGLAAALAATLRDLRDAGIPAGALGQAGLLAQLHQRCEEVLCTLAEEGLYDRIGLFRRAAQHADAWLARRGFRSIEVHGATELVGSAGDLIEALHARVPVHFAQADWGDDYAAELRRSWPWSFRPRPAPVCADPVLTRRDVRLDTVLRMVRAPDPHQELEEVALEILHRLEDGAAPSGILVVARTLDAHAPWIVPVLRRHGIPLSLPGEPVLRRPAVRARLDLARVLLGGLERDATLRLLGSPRLRWPAAAGEEPAAGALVSRLAEILARRGRVLRGAPDWLHAIRAAEQEAGTEPGGRRAPGLRRLEHALRELEQDRTKLGKARGWSARATLLSALVRRWLRDPGTETERRADAAADTAAAGLAQLDAVDRACGATTDPGAEEILTTLEQALRSRRARLHDADPGGVRVLDAAHARALPADHLFVIGLDHGSWPLDLGDDPFLPGPLRERLRQRTGRPIPVPARQEEESRFLLGLLLSQARRSVWLSWHERDAEGRERSPSLYLGALPLIGADPPPPEPTGSSPRSFLHASDALIEAAAASGPGAGEDALAALAARIWPEQAEGLARGLQVIRATEASASADLAHDGSVGTAHLDPERPVSPSFLESLGRCPQRALFSGLLRIRETEDPPPHEPDARETGTILHGVLQRVYTRLFQEGKLAPGRRPEEALERARELLPGAIAGAAPGLRELLLARHRTLWSALEQQILESSTWLLCGDLSELLPGGVTGLRTECALELVRRGPDGVLRVRGKADRVLELPDGAVRVGDYKSTRDPGKLLRPAEIKRGERLQIPVYAMAASATLGTRRVECEVLGVPLHPDRLQDPRRVRGHRRPLEEVEAWAAPALDVLAGLLRAGRFPFRRHDGCRTCPYTVACRSKHPPSEERVRQARPFADYFRLHGSKA